LVLALYTCGKFYIWIIAPFVLYVAREDDFNSVSLNMMARICGCMHDGDLVFKEGRSIVVINWHSYIKNDVLNRIKTMFNISSVRK
jgi:hypothetical protein